MPPATIEQDSENSEQGASMNTRLGRGLGALIPSAPAQPATVPGQSATTQGGNGQQPGGERLADVPGARFAEISVDSISPNPRQPRTAFDEDAMAELAYSVKEIGLLQPIVVRRLGGDRYELVMGERRWRATQQAGLTTIPAIVRDTQDDAMLRDALLENLHRSQLNPLEEAAAYQQMLDDFGCTQEVLSSRIGRSRPQISNTLRLLKLPASVQRRVAAGVLSAGHARALLGLPSGDAQERLAQRIVAEGLSVRSVEELVALGDSTQDERPARRQQRRPVAPRLTDLADRLSDRFETRVKVDLGKTKGRITVEFASLDDLERIVELMDPDKTK
jgi:ParB family transcriptional regulator, chromosome partitioning protein